MQFSRPYLSEGQAYGMVVVRRPSVRLSVTDIHVLWLNVRDRRKKLCTRIISPMSNFGDLVQGKHFQIRG